MKLTSALLLLATGPALAQTAKPPVHHTARPATHTAAKPAVSTGACGSDTAPSLPVAIPAAPGCAKPLYALRFIDTLVGTGAPVAPRKWLTVNYTGYLIDGTKFDSSIGKDPITFPYGAHQVISGWDTGFEGMNIGGKRRLFIPYELAYGESGRPPVIPAKAQLIFDLELVAMSDNPPASKTPPAPAAPPAGSAPATPAAPPSTTPGAGTKPAPDGAKPTAPAPTTDPTKPTATPPKP